MALETDGTLGTYFPGDTVQVTRTFYTSDTRPHPPTGAEVSAVIYFDGTELMTLSPSVTSVAARPNISTPLPKRAFAVSLTFQVPDIETPPNTPLTIALSCTVYQSVDPSNFVMESLYETIVVQSKDDRPKGALSSVSIYPDNLSFPYEFRTYGNHVANLTVYHGNTAIATYTDISSQMTMVRGTPTYRTDASLYSPSLMPYAALWTVDGAQEVVPIFVINPSIAMAMREVFDFVNKNTSDWATEDLTFTPEQIMGALYNGACLFNSEGSPTNFTMTNALGPIRLAWIQFSALWLLQTQIMNSIETDMSFTTASVTLDVDRASKYQQYADSLQSQLQERVKGMKTVMAKRGNIGGDGSADLTTLRPGAIAAIGLAMSPVSKVGYMLNPLSWRAALLGGGSNIGFQSY